jgi:hypothetical protein
MALQLALRLEPTNRAGTTRALQETIMSDRDHHLDRRALIAGGALLATLPGAARAALPVPTGNRLAFDVVRNGKTFGSHSLTFERNGDNLVVKVAVEMVFKAAFITLFRYRHTAIERWAGDQVVALDSKTDDNGKAFRVSGRREAQGFVVEATGVPRYIAPANALPATHWNRRELDGPWINTQDGKLVRPRVAPQGVENVPTAGAGSIRANRFVLSGDVDMDLYYDSQPSWAGLRFKGKDDSVIRYIRR